MDKKVSVEEEIMRKAGEARTLARFMSSTQDLVEEQIRKAIEKGEFDNLPGMGKPLNLEENPFEPEELRMVFRILKNNDFVPHWIGIGHDIDAEIDKIEQEVARFERKIEIFYSGRINEAAERSFQKKKELFLSEQARRIEQLYMRIVDYNLHCPTFREGRGNLETAKEVELIRQRIEDKINEAQTRYKNR